MKAFRRFAENHVDRRFELFVSFEQRRENTKTLRMKQRTRLSLQQEQNSEPPLFLSLPAAEWKQQDIAVVDIVVAAALAEDIVVAAVEEVDIVVAVEEVDIVVVAAAVVMAGHEPVDLD